MCCSVRSSYNVLSKTSRLLINTTCMYQEMSMLVEQIDPRGVLPDQEVGGGGGLDLTNAKIGKESTFGVTCL